MMIKQDKKIFVGLYACVLTFFAFCGNALATITENAIGDYTCKGCSEGGPNPADADCWVCSIFEMFFDTGNYVAYSSSEGLLSSCLTLLAVGLALWLAFHIMPTVASFKAGNPTQMLTKIGIGLLKAIVVASFLTIGLKPIFQYIISPVTSVAMGVSTKIMESVNAAEAAKNVEVGEKVVSLAIVPEPTIKYAIPIPAGEIVFDDEVRGGLLAIVKNTFATIDYAQSLASFIMCESTRPIQIDLGLVEIDIPFVDFKLLMIGLCAWIIFGLMSLIFPFYVIDAVFRAIIICLLSPLFMVAWVFPATAGYASKAFNIFLGCVVTFVVMGLVVAVGVRITLIPLSDVINISETEQSDLLSMCGDNNYLPRIVDVVDAAGGGTPFCILICGAIAIKYIKKVSEIVGVFGFEKVEAAVGDKMAGAGKQLAVAAASTALKVAGGAAGGVANKAGGAVKAIGNGKASEALKGVSSKFGAKANSLAGNGHNALGNLAKGVSKAAGGAAKATGGVTKAVQQVKATGKRIASAIKNAAAKVNDAKNAVKGKVKDVAGNTAMGRACNHLKEVGNGNIAARSKGEAFVAGFAKAKSDQRAAKKAEKQANHKTAKDFAKKMAGKIKKDVKDKVKDKVDRAMYGDTIVDARNALKGAIKTGKKDGADYKEKHPDQYT